MPTGKGFGLWPPSKGGFSLALLGHFSATPTSVCFLGVNARLLVKGEAEKHEGRVSRPVGPERLETKGSGCGEPGGGAGHKSQLVPPITPDLYAVNV